MAVPFWEAFNARRQIFSKAPLVSNDAGCGKLARPISLKEHDTRETFNHITLSVLIFRNNWPPSQSPVIFSRPLPAPDLTKSDSSAKKDAPKGDM